MIAALFVDPKGVYAELLAPECIWGADRDARCYRYSDPVVAHPPCQLWTNLAAVNYKRYGGAHNILGNDHGAFASALMNVRRCGGVLEHPAYSKAWPAYGLLRPIQGIWCPTDWPNEWVTQVEQRAYGHKARKRTWLLYVGRNPPFPLDWSEAPGTHQCGWFDRKRPTLGKREASATPKPFARLLIDLALQCGGP